MRTEICVVIEAVRGQVADISYTMLAAGRALADALPCGLSAVLVGHQVDRMADTLGVADRAHCLEDPKLADFNPEAYATALVSCLGEDPPRMILFGHTAMGTDLACAVAHALKVPLITSCHQFLVDGDPMYSCLTCGGKIVATGKLPETTCVATVMPGGYKSEDGLLEKKPPMDKWPVVLPDQLRTEFKAYIEPPAGDVDIARQEVLISVGRGIQNKDNIEMAESLAKALGGVVSGSRPVIDQGWLPSTRLVGKSGKLVKPKLYLALGISGAPEHAEAMRDADLIVAINTDEKAPIFDFATVGAAVDALELLPILTEKLSK